MNEVELKWDLRSQIHPTTEITDTQQVNAIYQIFLRQTFELTSKRKICWILNEVLCSEFGDWTDTLFLSLN